MNWNVIFDGIGTEIISLIIGGIIGGIGGYTIGIRKANKQKQKAGDKADQRQETHIVDDHTISSATNQRNTPISIGQYQEAGDCVKQV